jgi:hypothetical protein
MCWEPVPYQDSFEDQANTPWNPDENWTYYRSQIEEAVGEKQAVL